MSDKQSGTETKRSKAVARRREQILEAAVTCFIENGYHQTGVRDIARRAGISLGNLYNHFPGKHDVLAEIAALERATAELAEAWAAKCTDTHAAADKAYEAAARLELVSVDAAAGAAVAAARVSRRRRPPPAWKRSSRIERRRSTTALSRRCNRI